MTVHHVQGPEGAASPDEIVYLRSENVRLNRDNVRLRQQVRVLEQAAAKEWREFAKDNVLRRLRLDNLNLQTRNLELMAKLARALKEPS